MSILFDFLSGLSFSKMLLFTIMVVVITLGFIVFFYKIEDIAIYLPDIIKVFMNIFNKVSI